MKDKELYSDTREAKLHDILIYFKQNYYKLNIIDTPGLFEIRSNEDEIRNNEQLLNLAFDCMDNNITKVHAFIIVHNSTVALTPENINVFKLFYEKFNPEIRYSCFLLLTHCEKITIEKMNKIFKQINEDKTINVIKNLCRGGILFNGSLDFNYKLDYESYPDMKSNTINMIQKLQKITLKKLLQYRQPVIPSDHISEIINKRFETMRELKKRYY